MLHIDWQPAKKGPLPLYRQIFLYIRDKILSGQWPVGTKLPPQRELAAKLGVNRNTLLTAVDELVASGFLDTKQGSGCYVSNNSWSQFSTNRADWQPYINSAAHLGNLPLIQQINQLEFDPHMIRLGTGELAPALLPAAELKEILHTSSAKIDSFGYQEPLGLKQLREQISQHLKKSGIEVSPAGILIVSGALQALQLIFFGLIAPDSHVFIERPSYLSSLKLFQSRQLHFSEVPLDQEGIDIHALRCLQKRRTHSILYTIPTFHNPTGCLMSPERRCDLLHLAQQLRLPIVEDNVYYDLWLDAPPPPPLKALDDAGNVLFIDSLSKSIGPGLRIGWIAGPKPIIEQLGDLKMQHDYGSSILSQWAAAEWFASGLHEVHMQQLRQKLRQRRELMLSVLKEHFSQLATWQRPHGGFYIWLKLNRSLSMPQLFKAARRENILLNPGNIYDSLASAELRLSYAFAEPEDLKTALIRLARVLQKLA